jgi:hypothetical protein
VDVASWLRELGLERYEAAFRENEVSTDLLHQLTAEDLKDLLRSEHRGTLVTSRRFAFPEIYAASTAASSIGEIVTEFKRQLP